MKPLLVVLRLQSIGLLSICWLATAGCTAPRLQARVDPRVELLSIVFRLAGNPEFNQATAKSAYSEAVDRHFSAWRDHAAIQMARELREKNGVGFDAVPGLAVHLDQSFALRDNLPQEARPERLDQRWAMNDVRRFVESLQEFAQASKFNEFLESQSDRYSLAAARLTDYVGSRNPVPWFDRYFRLPRRAQFGLICGMLTGGCCYGTSVRFRDGTEEITPVIGVWRWDEAGAPLFGDDVFAIVVHEFAHVYVNPTMDAFMAQLRPIGERLLEKNRDRMESMAYGGADALLYESLVRACVVRYRHDGEGEAAGREQLLAEWSSGFLWTDLLADCLAEYEGHRRMFPTFEHYMPTICNCFERIYGEHAQIAARFPAVVGFEPRGTKGGIDSSTTVLRLIFDRPMVVKSSLDNIVPAGASWAGRPSLTSGDMVLTIPVKLAPDTEYELTLNGAGRPELCSREGFPLLPTPISFKTMPN